MPIAVVLQCVAVRCSVLQYVAFYGSWKYIYVYIAGNELIF